MKPGPKMLPRHTAMIVKMYERTGSTRRTAIRLGVSRSTVQRHLRAAEVEMRPAGRPVS